MSSIRFISVLSLFLLSSVFCRAEKTPVYEEFSSLGSGGLKLSEDNHVAKTATCIYKCTSDAVFGFDFFNTPSENKKVSINFSGADQVMTTSAIDSLAGLDLYYYYKTSPSVEVPHINVQLSRDSVHWTDPIESDGMYTTNGRVEASFVPGRYYVRLTNANSNKASIYAVRFSFGGCNCFLYIPE